MPARRRIQQSGASVTTFCTKHRTSRHQSVFTQLCLGLRSANTNRHETQFLRPRPTTRAATSGLRIRRCEILRSRRRGRCSPWDEKVRILAFMLRSPAGRRFAIFCGTTVCGAWSFQRIYGTVSRPISFVNFPGLIRCFLGFCRPNRIQNFRFQNGRLY
jgi:hypothetical protein